MRGDGAFNRFFITTVIFPVPNDVGSAFHRVWIFREHFSVILSKITIAFRLSDICYCIAPALAYTFFY